MGHVYVNDRRVYDGKGPYVKGETMKKALMIIFLSLVACGGNNEENNTPIALKAPTQLSLKQGSGGTLVLTWDVVKGASAYEVRVEGGQWTRVESNEYTDASPQLPEPMVPGIIASDATIREHVSIESEQMIPSQVQGVSATYEVRAVDQSGKEGPASTASPVDITLSIDARLEKQQPNGQWQEIGQSLPYEDKQASGVGEVSSYRLVLTREDGQRFEGAIDEGSRLAIVQLTGSSYTTCLLYNSGDVRCWGYNDKGVLGLGEFAFDGENLGDDEPVLSKPVVSLGEPALKVTKHNRHACALLQSGDVRCWGFEREGRLGTGNDSEVIGDDETPASIPTVDIGGKVQDIHAGSGTVCVLLTNQAVKCWGFGTFGSLGYGNKNSIGDDEVPSDVGSLALPDDVVQIDTSAFTVCARMSQGTVKCWGVNGDGELGQGNKKQIGDDETPDSINTIKLPVQAVDVRVGESHVCILDGKGEVYCWGKNDQGQLGSGNTENLGDDETLENLKPVDVGGKVVQLSLGYGHTCAVLENGDVRCWGQNDYGQLGYGNTETVGDNEIPASQTPVALGGPAWKVFARGNHTCAILQTGDVRCWGRNDYGQLGYGNTNALGDDEVVDSVGVVPLYPQ